jgi:hypothetical protein
MNATLNGWLVVHLLAALVSTGTGSAAALEAAGAADAAAEAAGAADAADDAAGAADAGATDAGAVEAAGAADAAAEGAEVAPEPQAATMTATKPTITDTPTPCLVLLTGSSPLVCRPVVCQLAGKLSRLRLPLTPPCRAAPGLLAGMPLLDEATALPLGPCITPLRNAPCSPPLDRSGGARGPFCYANRWPGPSDPLLGSPKSAGAC